MGGLHLAHHVRGRAWRADAAFASAWSDPPWRATRSRSRRRGRRPRRRGSDGAGRPPWRASAAGPRAASRPSVPEADPRRSPGGAGWVAIAASSRTSRGRFGRGGGGATGPPRPPGARRSPARAGAWLPGGDVRDPASAAAHAGGVDARPGRPGARRSAMHAQSSRPPAQSSPPPPHRRPRHAPVRGSASGSPGPACVTSHGHPMAVPGSTRRRGPAPLWAILAFRAASFFWAALSPSAAPGRPLRPCTWPSRPARRCGELDGLGRDGVEAGLEIVGAGLLGRELLGDRVASSPAPPAGAAAAAQSPAARIVTAPAATLPTTAVTTAVRRAMSLTGTGIGLVLRCARGRGRGRPAMGDDAGPASRAPTLVSPLADRRGRCPGGRDRERSPSRPPPGMRRRTSRAPSARPSSDRRRDAITTTPVPAYIGSRAIESAPARRP